MTCIKVREHERQKGGSDRLKVKMEMNLSKRLTQIFGEETDFAISIHYAFKFLCRN